MLIPAINNIAEICHQRGIKYAVICPGSRSAPLAIAFSEHGKIELLSISDERSAAYLALGIAQASSKTVALICTSGTAALNFAPAIAEAFFLEIPLLILTADRPKEWIDQYDGQTIYQEDIYAKNIKKSYTLLPDYQTPDVEQFVCRTLHEAITFSESNPNGPVHINVPIREPFYPEKNEKIAFNQVKNIITYSAAQNLSEETWRMLFEQWEDFPRKLIVVGQQWDERLFEILKKISEEFCVPFIADVIGNAGLSLHDIFLPYAEEDLKPDLLITVGMSSISKNLKKFLRQHKPTANWHIHTNLRHFDPFLSLTHKILLEPHAFFSKLYDDLDYKNFLAGDEDADSDFYTLWQQKEVECRKETALKCREMAFSDLRCLFLLMDAIPENSLCHLGNSMAVRYVNLLPNKKQLLVWSNRGTSGIDGSLSTAIGNAIAHPDKIMTCILGDVSFQYDKNALWNQYLPANLRIVILNNGGGNIFRMLKGPQEQVGFKAFFETIQTHTAERIAKEFNCMYCNASDEKTLLFHLETFYEPSDSPKILEFFTDGFKNEETFKSIFSKNS